MGEKPILFSGPLVRAILEGRKTQTRRLVQPRTWDPHTLDLRGLINHGGKLGLQAYFGPDNWGVSCPCGVPGDRLWVRETWQAYQCVSAVYDEWEPITREVRCAASWADHIETNGKPDAIEYRATSESRGPWTPSIHMPRWASRITLEVTSVRVERLQDISEEDAMAEGVTKVRDACYVVRGFDYDLSGLCHTSAITPFQKLWDDINGKRASWDSNPWAWVVSFRRVEASHG